MKEISTTDGFAKKMKRFFGMPKIKVAIGILVYIGLLASYMSPVIANCSERFIGVPGDQTVYAWLSEASPDSPPFWGPTSMTNAPFGEDLYEPMHITGLLPYTATWLMNKVVSPNCSFNILMASGFVLSATVMFLFIIWLLRGRGYLAAWFGGYLVAFTPYLMAKTPYHVSYVYCGLLVGALWLLLALWRKKSYKLAAGLMLLTAGIFYHDPYFIQLVIILYASFFIGLALYVWRSKIPWRNLWDFTKKLLLTSPILLILISPMLITRVVHNDQINSVVENSRGEDIIVEGLAYGARPWEFIFPSTENPLLPDRLVQLKLDNQHGSNPAETTLYLGLVPLGLTAWLVWMLARRRADELKLKSPVDIKLVLYVVGALIIVSASLSLLPRASIFGFELHFPSELLLNITSMWRVPARLVVLVQIGLAITSALAMYLAIIKLRKYKMTRVLVISVLLIASFLEFMSYNPFNRQYWGYDEVPAAYTEIKDNNSVKRIAEYPMLDAPRNYAFVYYQTYQGYHEKPMINSFKVSSPTKKYRESIADLYDWQTLGALKRLQVDRVVVHGDNSQLKDNPGLINVAKSYDPVAKVDVFSYSISNNVDPKDYILKIDDGFAGPSNYSFEKIDYYVHGRGRLVPQLLPDANDRTNAIARIEVYGFDKTNPTVTFKQGGVVVASVKLSTEKTVIEFAIDTSKPIDIESTKQFGDRTVVISNMEIK